MAWQDLLTALALVLVLEGMYPFINPDGWRRMMLMLAQLTDQQLRFAGLSSMLVGLLLLYVIK
ncbi:MAG: DUF2065 domain-containing protein [Gammaproteobacteria bacterium]|nr:DUF2065 domain-containing protein [Gammaproteobacteria bacterium]